jgi:glycosyltransferase involved in cell wall biosynthesis
LTRATRHTIDIGSSVEFHGGIHGSLLSDPPPGTRYRVATPEHVFLREQDARGSFRPNRDFAVAEVIDPGPGRALFHSARWPVLNRGSWVVDLDDFGYPVLWGRSAIDPAQRRAFARRGSRLWQRSMLARSARMLAAYTHPSCKAILFLTERGVTEARQLLRTVASPAVARAFLERCEVVPGAHRTLDRAEMKRKWRDDPLTVVFCGRDYHQKNGRVGLAVMTSLARRFPSARFHYIGEAPRDALTRGFDALPNASVHGPLPRAEALRLVAGSHVLFHPARYESFGMAYAEAMAGGLAIVSSAGSGMGHVGEFLGKEGAVLVRRNGDDSARDRSLFERALGRVMADRDAAAAMAAANYRAATSGVLSVRHRNELLRRIYRRAEAAPAEPLRIDDLSAIEPPARVVRLAARELMEDFEAFRRAAPRAPASVLLEKP